MPIRFRCAYCNQLMGIAKRKAGAVVRCPRCAGEVIVPAEQEPQAANGPGRLNQFFEAEDFERPFAEAESVPEALPNPLLPPPAYAHAPLPEAAAPALPAVLAPVDAGPQPFNVQRAGMFFTPVLLVGLGIFWLVSVGLVFLLGFFLGRASL